jgi:hypothetical protein
MGFGVPFGAEQLEVDAQKLTYSFSSSGVRHT